MHRHLDDEQFTGATSGNFSEETSRHLQSCSSCRAELEQLKDGLQGLRKWLQAESCGPEWFWEGQRHSIRAAVDRAVTAKLRHFAWACAGVACVVVLASSLLMKPRSAVTPALTTDPDHELLLEVQRSVKRELPVALEPAALLAHEVSSNAGIGSKAKGDQRP